MDRGKDLRTHAIAAAIALTAIAPGCGGGSHSTPVTRVESPSPTNARVRFIDGSPDRSASHGSISVIARSGQYIANVAYANVSSFVQVTGSIAADFTITFSSSSNALTCTTPFQLLPGAYYTVVVAGSPTGIGNQALQCQFFSETYASSATAQLLFHHASPAAFLAGQGTLVTGTFNLVEGTFGVGSVLAPLGTATFVTTLGGAANAAPNSASGQTQPFAFPPSGPGGIGFYVVPSASPSPAMLPSTSPSPSSTPTPAAASPSPSPSASPSPTLTPEAIALPAQATFATGGPSNLSGALPDPSNTFPIGPVTTFSLYVIDAPPGSTPPFELLGVID